MSSEASRLRQEAAVEMLQEHVPLALIRDMVAPHGPRARELLEAEGLPEQEWWARS